MLIKNMNLRQMLDYKPTKEEQYMLALNIQNYLKITVISKTKETNYKFIRSFFLNEQLKELVADISKLIFYDFDATEIENSKRFITLFDFVSKYDLETILKAFQNNLNADNDVDIFIDIYDLDNKHCQVTLIDNILSATQK